MTILRSITSITLCLISLVINKASAQTFEKKYGGPLQESARSLEVLPDGGYMILGHTTSHSAGTDTNVCIIRTSAMGDTMWTKMLGESDKHNVGYTIHATNDGNFVVCGSTGNNYKGNSDAWLFKIDTSATIIWSKTQGSYGTEVALDFQQTSDDGFIVTGHQDLPGAPAIDAFLWKLDKNGATSWMKTYGGTNNDEGHSVKQTTDGGYIFLGQTFSFGAGDLDFYLVKTTSDGTFEWQKTYGGPLFDRGQYLLLTADGYILTGDTKNYGAGDYDAYLIKVDTKGDVQWTKTYGGTDKDITKMIQKTSDGGYVIIGNVRSFGLINPDFWIIKVTATGDVQWTRNYGDIHHEHGYYIKELKDGSYIVLGHSVRYYTPDYNVDIYLVKVNNEGQVLSTKEEIGSDETTLVFPNPSAGTFNLRIPLTATSNHEITLTDVTGRTVYATSEAKSESQINLPDIGKGIYFLTVYNDQRKLRKKIVIN